MKKDKALIATIVFALFFYVGIYLGQIYQEKIYKAEEVQTPKTIAIARFLCDDGKAISTKFREREVSLALSDGRSMILPQTISASGARYANEDESFVFWNKGDTAFIQEGEEYTYENCVVE
jgi:membrane-bound inhibitor of C-type lysozyme